jgi:hypothetical protein
MLASTAFSQKEGVINLFSAIQSFTKIEHDHVLDSGIMNECRNSHGLG